MITRTEDLPDFDEADLQAQLGDAAHRVRQKVVETVNESPSIDDRVYVEREARAEASVPNQFYQYPDTVLRRTPEVEFLNMRDPAERARYAELLGKAKQHPPVSPAIEVISSERQQFEGGWTVLIVYDPLAYEQL